MTSAQTIETSAQSASDRAFQQTTADDPLMALTGDRPISLFPVRLETRFILEAGKRELRIRIFPEELHINTHEEALTAEELEWGQAYLERTVNIEAEADKLAAWAELADRFTAPRAAWIVRALSQSTPPEQRDSSWSRAPYTDLMPDRWLIVGCTYQTAKDQHPRTVEQFRVLGNPIPARLKAGWDPQAEVPEGNPETLHTDEGMRWMVDFEEAERVGMAVRIDLTDYSKKRIPVLLAVGVKASAGDASNLLTQQFEALRYTTTLGFLPQGTPTNNTETATAGYTQKDPLHQRHFAQEYLQGEAPDSSNAARMATALGLSRALFSHVWQAHADDQRGTSAMNRVLWPATCGYFIDRMLGGASALVPDRFPPDFSHVQQMWSENRQAAYDFFKDHVRARGPLPALRIGQQPYGVLPLVDLDRWQPVDGSEALDNNIRTLFQTIQDRNIGSSHYTGTIHRVGAGTKPNQTLASILALSPIPVKFGLYHLISEKMLDVLCELHQVWEEKPMLDEAWGRLNNFFAALGAGPLNLANAGPANRPFLGRSIYQNTLHMLDMLVVKGGPLSSTEPLSDNYLAEIQASSLLALRDIDWANSPKTLLFFLVRHAKLSAYLRAIERSQSPNSLTYIDEELYNITADDDITCWDRAANPYPDSSRAYLEEYDQRSQTGSHSDPDLIDFDTGLAELQGLPTAELDLLFRETLALIDYRYDAWATGFATKRLKTLRAQQSKGSYVGGYSWLFDLKVPSLKTDQPQQTASTVGYIHAPSIDQAKTAALLRSGQQARTNEAERNPFNIDLSSQRVHQARQLFDGVREGQSLAALLGYRFERRLQERGLAGIIPAMRREYPIAAEKDQVGSDQEITVVDGWKLIDTFRRHADFASQPDWIPKEVKKVLSTAQVSVLEEVGHEVERSLDAASDAVIAESVFQTLRGNSARAGAALDAIANGTAPPPELESQRTPRQGRTVSHRLFIPLQKAQPSDRARAQAAPRLNAFCSHVLDDSIHIAGTYRDAAGNELAQQSIQLSQLGLDAIDIVYLSTVEPSGQSDLERLLRDRMMSDRPDTVVSEATLQLDLSTQPVLEQARALYRLVASSRALSDEDLLKVGDSAESTVNIAELKARVDQAISSFDQLSQSLNKVLEEDAINVKLLRATLYKAAMFGIPGSIPQVGEAVIDAATVLAEQAQAVAEVIETRQVQLQILETAGSSVTTDAEKVKLYTQQLKHVFGDSFVVLPTFTPTYQGEIAAGFDAADSLLAGNLEAPEELLSQIAMVRPAVEQLQRLRDYTDILNPERLSLAVTQLPFTAGIQWAGLPGVPAENGTVSLIALQPSRYRSADPLAGLFIDTWEDLIPGDTQTTGLAFNYNTPNSEPPQAILLATAADPSQPWSTEELLNNVRRLVETMPFRGSHIKNRELGHMLPATFFAFNVENDTVSTDFSAYLD